MVAVSYVLALCVGYYLVKYYWPSTSATLLIAMLAFAGVIGEVAVFKLPTKIVFYLYFGVLTTLVAQVSFNLVLMILTRFFGVYGGYWWILPQTISWVLAVVFAFVSNRYFVFEGQNNAFLSEMGKFFLARLGSGIFVEYLGMFLLVNLIGLPAPWSKLLTSIIVVIVNYVFSQRFVFKKRQDQSKTL